MYDPLLRRFPVRVKFHMTGREFHLDVVSDVVIPSGSDAGFNRRAQSSTCNAGRDTESRIPMPDVPASRNHLLAEVHVDP